MINHLIFKMITKRVSKLEADLDYYIKNNRKNYYNVDKLEKFNNRRSSIKAQLSDLAVAGVLNYQSDETQYIIYRLEKIQSSIHRVSHNAIKIM